MAISSLISRVQTAFFVVVGQTKGLAQETGRANGYSLLIWRLLRGFEYASFDELHAFFPLSQTEMAVEKPTFVLTHNNSLLGFDIIRGGQPVFLLEFCKIKMFCILPSWNSRPPFMRHFKFFIQIIISEI